MLYYRDHYQFEVDLVVENAAVSLIGVEVKVTATVKESDLRGLKHLSNVAGKQFQLGVILYDGTESLPLGDRLWRYRFQPYEERRGKVLPLAERIEFSQVRTFEKPESAASAS